MSKFFILGTDVGAVWVCFSEAAGQRRTKKDSVHFENE